MSTKFTTKFATKFALTPLLGQALTSLALARSLATDSFLFKVLLTACLVKRKFH